MQSDLPSPESFRNEPLLDFSRDDVRERFSRALETVRSGFPLRADAVIADEEVTCKSEISIASPNDLSLNIGSSAESSEETVERAVDAALDAFKTWSATPTLERAEALRRVAEAFHDCRFELAALEVHEAGKPWRDADADVCEAIDFLNYYASEILRIDSPEAMQPEILGERNELTYVPVGVCAVISPWNFPLAIPTGMIAAALAAGNAVVWKPAEQTPFIARRALAIMRSAGLPPGVVNLTPGRGEIAGRALVRSPDVALIAFTGSREVGLDIAEQCGRTRPGQSFVKRVIAEMGGKNAIIVDASADLDAAVPEILASAFGYSGQKCSACSRLIVLEPVADALIERIVEGTASLKIARATDPGCQLGPVIDAEAKRKVLSYIELGRSEAKELYAGEVGEIEGAKEGRGHYVPPAVFEAADPECRIATEEIFGPVLTLFRADNFDRALELANSTDFALTGGVFSRTPEHLEQARKRMRCGNLYLNRSITGAVVGRQPFGGFGMSGTGPKAGGPDYLKRFMNARTITENTVRQGFAPLDHGPRPD